MLSILAYAAARNASTCPLAPCWRCVGAGTAGCCRAPRPKKHAPTCECGAGGLRKFEAWGGSPRRADAPVFFLGVAKTGSESFRKDLPRHLRSDTKLADRPQERCLSAAPVDARVMTLLREPRANVRSQWHHCSQDQDGWFHPSKLPGSFGAWLAHWRSGAAARAFHCYLPFNLQTRVLSCKSADPCLPFATPALDTTALACVKSNHPPPRHRAEVAPMAWNSHRCSRTETDSLRPTSAWPCGASSRLCGN